MKVFTVTGITKSGKTTTIENIITELNRRGYSVGTVKEIHNEQFAIDTEGKNTYRHRQAGADTVTALGINETDIMYRGKMNIYDVLRHYTQDYVILEGVLSANVPRIAVAHNKQSVVIDNLTFIISGVVANDCMDAIQGIPVISATNNIGDLVDRIIEIVPPLMPDIDTKCCGECGKSCRELLSEIIKGKAKVNDCKVREGNRVKLVINGSDIDIAPFVDKVIYNTVIGVVKELKGYKEDCEIEIRI